MTSPPQSRAAALIAHLHALVQREDRGGLAALRRGLGKEPGTVAEMYRHVEPYLDGAGQVQADAAYLVASLFGFHPVPWKPPESHRWNTSFGCSLRRIRFREDRTEDEGVTRRFVAALNGDRDTLPVHLRHLLSLLHTRDERAPVSWERLFWDIVDWEEVDRRVQRRWAEAFWRGGDDTSGQASSAEPDSTEESS